MIRILALIFPAPANNKYQGSSISLYVFCLLTIITLVRSWIHFGFADGGAQSIASIPLDHFSSQASATIISIFSTMGLSQLLFGLLYVVVIFRYRSLIPLMWLFILLEYAVGMSVVFFWKPLTTITTPPGEIGGPIVILIALVMFILSLKKVGSK